MKLDKLAEQAEYERKYGISPLFRQKNAAALAPSEVFAYDWEISANSTAGKYLPFNFLIVTNLSSSCALDLYVNGDTSPIMMIPASIVKTIDQNSLPAFRSVLLKNTHASATVAIGEIEVTAQHAPISLEKIAQDMHRKAYGNRV